MTTNTPHADRVNPLWQKAVADLEAMTASGELVTSHDLNIYAAAFMRITAHHNVHLRGVGPQQPDYYDHVADEIDRLGIMLIDTGKLIRQLSRAPETTPQ